MIVVGFDWAGTGEKVVVDKIKDNMGTSRLNERVLDLLLAR